MFSFAPYRAIVLFGFYRVYIFFHLKELPRSFFKVLEPLVAYAVENGIISDDKREYFAGKLMNIVCKRPGEIADIFDEQHRKNPVKAFDRAYRRRIWRRRTRDCRYSTAAHGSDDCGRYTGARPKAQRQPNCSCKICEHTSCRQNIYEGRGER